MELTHRNQPAPFTAGQDESDRRRVKLTPGSSPVHTIAYDPHAEALLPRNFETKAAAIAEDRLRWKQLNTVIPNAARGWFIIRHVVWMSKQGTDRANHPALDYEAGRALIAKLGGGITTGRPSATIASMLHMRTVRKAFIRAAIPALVPLGWQNLQTFTLMNEGWVFTPDELDQITSKLIKARVRTHLNRIGIKAERGFFLAFLHGEFDPVSRLYTLHFHGVTTHELAQDLRKLIGKWGYVRTRTSANPLVCKGIHDPQRQLSYLLKGYWPAKGVRELDGSHKRDRRGTRIPEPFHTQYLFWLDRQRLSDLTVMVGGWSRRSGGSEAMRQLYFSTIE